MIGSCLRKFLLILALAFLARCGESEPPLTIAAASSLQPVVERLLPRFEVEAGIEVRAVYGSSGKLTAQILAGAPYDVFLSAAARYTDTLHRRGLTGAEAICFARGQLAVWAVDSSVQLTRVPLLALPGQPQRLRYALANPRAAPYGLAARQWLEHTGTWEVIQPQLAFGESVAQAAQFVQSGAADAGFVAAALPLSLPEGRRGRFFLVPQRYYAPIVHTVAVVEQQGARTQVQRANGREMFVTFLRSKVARQILMDLGYSINLPKDTPL